MSNTLNLLLDDPKWESCGFAVEPTANQVFINVLDYVKTHEETDFLTSGQSILANLSLSNDAEVHKLNREFRGFDKPTNVLSFANIDDEEFDNYIKTSDEIELGDIIIAYETLAREAQEKQISLHDHFVHLLTHGLLHLLGFDHQEDDEAEYMESFEIDILQQQGIQNPYQE